MSLLTLTTVYLGQLLLGSAVGRAGRGRTPPAAAGGGKACTSDVCTHVQQALPRAEPLSDNPAGFLAPVPASPAALQLTGVEMPEAWLPCWEGTNLRKINTERGLLLCRTEL